MTRADELVYQISPKFRPLFDFVLVAFLESSDSNPFTLTCMIRDPQQYPPFNLIINAIQRSSYNSRNAIQLNMLDMLERIQVLTPPCVIVCDQ